MPKNRSSQAVVLCTGSAPAYWAIASWGASCEIERQRAIQRGGEGSQGETEGKGREREAYLINHPLPLEPHIPQINPHIPIETGIKRPAHPCNVTLSFMYPEPFTCERDLSWTGEVVEVSWRCLDSPSSLRIVFMISLLRIVFVLSLLCVLFPHSLVPLDDDTILLSGGIQRIRPNPARPIPSLGF
jgi:hypothetical protein